MIHTVKSHERIISDQCRANRGDFACVADVTATVDYAINQLMGYWPIGKGAKIIITVNIEYESEGERK